jgi:uncharacterized protein YhhL (DUF1145 family)
LQIRNPSSGKVKTVFQKNEFITLLITVGIGIFFWANRKPITQLHAWKLLVLSFVCYLARMAFTVLESCFWTEGLNLLEHLSILLFSIFFLLWCWQIGYRKEKNQ